MIFFLASFYVKADSSSIKANLPTASPSRYALPTLSFGTPAPTLTSTLDYEELGLPSPTTTPTLNYVDLASHYLTPFPTSTAAPPLWTATSPLDNPLLDVVARKLPQNWALTPLPVWDSSYASPRNNETQAYLQATTDLMNFIDADQELYVQYVESWKPQDRYSMIGDTWLLENDFDNDGQSEWLASIPVFFAHPDCCGQFLIIFEKVSNAYKPMHYEWKFTHVDITKVVLIDDLNNDGLLEIVLRNIGCGSACSQLLTVATWDGREWINRYIQSIPTSLISFVDRDYDGKTEIIIDYKTYYKLDTLYPMREAIDVYGWKDGQLIILEESRQPTTDTYGIMRDIYSALSFGKIDQALDLAEPVIDGFEEKCEQKETYIGIEVMLAYGIKENPTAMQATLSKIMAYCNQSNSGFTHAANVLWQAYKQSHDTLLACQAMKRFISKSGLQFFDVTVVLPNYNYCPLQQE